ncbi:cupin-like domain-containing protein [Sphingomonas cavernae]|uniref:Cupin-like domain-containing protein n=1 Tax=Sphingomonas cavernae TaxID=2320861 RepID=A0A418WRR2_9SPHN|nr:cupin-like domain-containing protein [Sphingomonas cavernae]RJF93943.1 cupin-like domain-containing protein [Sphingomonas cavernae]
MANRKKMRGGGNAAAVVNDDLRREIAEALVFGVEPDRLAQRLAGRGVAHGLAVAEVERAVRSPYMAGSARLSAQLAKRDWVLASYARLAAQRVDADRVPRLHAPDAAQFYGDHYHAHRPVLLAGLIDHWPAMQRWSLDDFDQRFGDRQVHVQWGRESNKDYEINSTTLSATRRFSEFIARLRQPEPSNDFYMTANNNDHNRRALAELWDDVGDIPGYLAEQPDRDGFLWIGPRGTITPWHHDLTNNLLLQIRGTKRVRLVASHDTPLMRNHRHCFSEWTGEELPPGPAVDGRPAVLECDIAPGEALFIPVGWWHHVEARDVTIGMSFTNFAADNDFYSFYASYGTL